MNAREALQELSDFAGEAGSFIDTFEHEDHGDYDAGFGPDECRFDSASTAAFGVLEDLIASAGHIIDAENDIRTGNVAASWLYDVADLARILGRELKPHPDFDDEG